MTDTPMKDETADALRVNEALFDALHTLERLRELTPFRANETTVSGLHQAVRAIAASAVERLTPALSERATDREGGKVTTAEIAALFPDRIPMEASIAVHEATSADDLRRRLTAIAASQPIADLTVAQDEDLYTRWVAGDETVHPTTDQHHRFQARADRETRTREWRGHYMQAIGAAISNRNWHSVEAAYERLRDSMDRSAQS